MKYILRNKDSASSLLLSLELAIVMLLGFGRYRSCLFLICYFVIIAILQSREVKINTFRIFYVLVVIVAIYYDIRFGQVWPSFESVNIIHFFVAFIVVDYTSGRYLNNLIERLSKGYVFSYCSSCRYENVKLTEKCAKCGTSNSSNYNERLGVDSNPIYAESFCKNLDRLKCRLGNKTIRNLCLSKTEEIVFSIKVNFINGIYKNDIKYLCSYVVITSENLIFIYMDSFHRGWYFREKVKINLIRKVCASNKNIGVSGRQVVQIHTKNEIYEFFLWLRDKPSEVHLTHVLAIKDGIDSIILNDS